ncbi:hypothetical protein EV217_4271 [Phyllobacterium myrsinacearum]|uniref:hypothetical protein n=1 Tax=Phyllobacterium myrsinacearum TaxID=28101 RepID=UPI00102A460D|nr:hypothetical protein [Phyllobacterium myrsinacearum]RZS77605.1 hypothetical protein EV217_4271 [Phyllobacterium myrsinacearum]
MNNEQLMIEYIAAASIRIFRAGGYALLGLILLRVNLFGTPFSWSIPIALGILGCATNSARIAQIGIIILLIMAIVPLDFVKMLVV